MIVEKKSYRIPEFQFEISGRKIPVTLGYETYGKLNPSRDNAVLLCHYFTGTSHAAGKYDPADPLPGWWDNLIGPGKTIDTDRFFVLCSDIFSNINFHNPKVITTGPASIDPETGREYGMEFPIFTMADAVRAQKALLDELGIPRLHCVLGPSMGGLQAFQWARCFPEMVGKVLAVVSTPMMPPSTLMVPNQLGINAIMLDRNWKNGSYYGSEPPREGLLLAFKILLMSTRAEVWAERNFGRKPADPTFQNCPDPFRSFQGKFLVESEVEKTVIQRMQFFDANSYIYIAKANTLFDLCAPGEALPEVLGRMKMPVLMIIDDSDLLFTRHQSETALVHLPHGEAFYYDSHNGHLSCLNDLDYFSERMRSFLS